MNGIQNSFTEFHENLTYVLLCSQVSLPSGEPAAVIVSIPSQWQNFVILSQYDVIEEGGWGHADIIASCYS